MYVRAVFSEVYHVYLAAVDSHEAHCLIAGCALILALAYLDVRHKDLWGTDHLTGTLLHYLLRHVGYSVMLRVVGQPQSHFSMAYAAFAYGLPLVHAALSYACGRWLLRLDERARPASTRECAVALSSSYAFCAATLQVL